MDYIRNMTSILLDEIALAERMAKYGEDRAYGIWFTAKADDMIETVQSDFRYYVEVTDIRKRAQTDEVAAAVYSNLKERIDRLKT